MLRLVRSMVLKPRTGWGYETLVREVAPCGGSADAVTERVPDASTIRTLTRHVGPDVIDEIARLVIGRELREKGFVARAVRVDSTVAEAEVRYPTTPRWQPTRHACWRREAKKAIGLTGEGASGVTDRSRSAGRKLTGISRRER